MAYLRFISLFLIALALPACAQRYVAKKDPTELGIPFDRYTCQDKFDRAITFYLSKPKVQDKRPLILFVQGSGGQSVWSRRDGRISGGLQNLLLSAASDAARVLIVEKPGIEFCYEPKQPGTAEGCPKEFLEEHTFERWAEANAAAVKACLAMPEIDKTKVLASGHSEGGIVAAGVAAIVPEVTHAASLAGGGPSQLFDMMQITNAEIAMKQWEEIQKDPMSTEKFVWAHPHRRWSTFLATSPIEQLLKSKAKILLVQGTKDRAVWPTTIDIAEAELLSHNREVKAVRLENADHGFARPGMEPADGFRNVFRLMLEWFLPKPD
ncbi:MAG: prolyl oligopeptidase family serine peptidase [Fimbriimonadaceae bacterium]|nr:prolyl oligopeptidase family serine peptidase [Fimbriimonadaceae bacterium]